MSKVLVAYFSASGVTRKVAAEIAKAEQAELLEQDENTVPLSEYKGTMLLIVNTATGCGASPLFQYLSVNTSFVGFGMSPMVLILKGVVKKMTKAVRIAYETRELV